MGYIIFLQRHGKMMMIKKKSGPLVVLSWCPYPCDECIDTWKLSGWKWLDEVTEKNYYGGDWFLFDVIDEGMIGN